MTRRRPSPGLPPNFRYPLITPVHDRDSFIDYDVDDGDAGHSQDHLVYPSYQTRDKSPAPQIVRVAKQPEMIRRQSLRPFSGDWGTFDLPGPPVDVKVPGAYSSPDADAGDFGKEIIETVPRSAYSHPADIADLYSDVSEADMDFGEDSTLEFPQLTLEDVVVEVAYVLRTRSSPPAEGFAYVFADPTGRNKFYKIGSAKNVSKRANEHRSICNISSFRVQRKTAVPIRQYKRLEKLAQAELINMSYDPDCVCDIQQHRYFWGRQQTALEILDFWSKWLLQHAPYDKHGHLLPFWEHRLRVFESNIPKYFDCAGAKCIKRTSDTLACPICLRTGWREWVAPSALDKIEFASRTQIGSERAHQVLLYLHKYLPIPDHIWVASIDGIGQAISMCVRFKSPALLLNLLYARILIPILWSTIFTTSDYIPFMAMMEIAIYSGIYLLVRLELAQALAYGGAAGRRNKETRLLRRKAVPSAHAGEGASRGRPKEPDIVEIPDDRIRNLMKRTNALNKGNSKNSESLSVMLPDGRLKRLKPGRRRSDFTPMYPSPTSGETTDLETRLSSKRTPRACDACYKRKIKCDAAVPQCNWCSHHDSPCTFERKTRRTRKKVAIAKDNPQVDAQLSERITRIEKLLSEKLPQGLPHEAASPLPQQTFSGFATSSRDITPTPPALTQPSASSSVPLHFAGRELGAISLFTGIPFILPEGQEWVQSRTGQKLAFDRFTSSRAPWENQRDHNPASMLMHLQSPHAFDLPDRQSLEVNFNIFCSSLMQRVFPVVDPVLFWTTINSAYKERPLGFDSGRVSTKACIFAFAAFVNVLCGPCLISQGRQVSRLDEACTAKAKFLLCQVLEESPTLDGLQAVTMLALLELVTGNLQSANYYGLIAARMIFMLEGHIFSNQPAWLPQSSVDTRSRTQTHLRNLFWLCYTIEQDICLRTGQAQQFSEDNCDLTLPPGYVELMNTSLELHHNSTDLPDNPIFPMDLRLSLIKARAYTALYSFKALKKTDAEILKDIRELDDELERWRLSVPPKWRPTLSFSHETPDIVCSMHSVILRLNYHLCMTIIHQASSRFKSLASGPGCIMDGISSSLALSVEASRSTLLYLEKAGHVLVDGVFWMLIFYPMSALLAIFCNILQHPADLQASKDLALLKNATGMLERVFLRQASSVNELVHFKLVADFVNELCRLATCAMDKAWREKTGGTISTPT
ncbi:hypothetical protein BJX61DRAFT_530779 [Aspergillus egyptiacus]|nr:hypothetical protein BJX61DRAFT_530779 [Aspergillus egyptiacus]